MISINSGSLNFSENKENYDPDNKIFSRAGSPGGNIWRRRRRTKVVQTPSRQTKRIKRVPLMEIFLNGSLDETKTIQQPIQTNVQISDLGQY